MFSFFFAFIFSFYFKRKQTLTGLSWYISCKFTSSSIGWGFSITFHLLLSFFLISKKWFVSILKYKITTIHGIIKIFTQIAQVFNSIGMKVKTSDIGVINRSAASGVYKVGTVGGRKGVKCKGIFALRPC